MTVDAAVLSSVLLRVGSIEDRSTLIGFVEGRGKNKFFRAAGRRSQCAAACFSEQGPMTMPMGDLLKESVPNLSPEDFRRGVVFMPLRWDHTGHYFTSRLTF